MIKGKSTKKKKRSYAMIICLTAVVGFFILLLIFCLFISNYYLIGILYDSINEHYFSNEIIEPVINRNGNFTKAFDIRIKTLDDIILESKLQNVKAAINFVSEFYNFEPIPNPIHDNYDYSKDYMNPIENKKAYHYKADNKGLESQNHHILNEIIFRILGHFLPIFEVNFKKHFDIKELIIIDKDTKNYYSYCENRAEEYIFFDEASQNNEIIKKFSNELTLFPFADFIVYNQYQKGSYLNYIKLKAHSYSFPHTVISGLPASSNYIIGIRMKNGTFVKMFNNQRSNMTTIVQQMKFIEQSDVISHLHYFSQSDFLYNFYSYGFKNMVNHTLIDFKVQYEQEIMYINSQIESYFSLLSTLSSEKELQYKEEWSKEFIILTKIIYEQIQYYNKTEPIYQIPNDLNCKEIQNKILCEAKKNHASYQFSMSVYSDKDQSSTTEPTMIDFYETVKISNNEVQKNKFDNSSIVIEYDVFTQKNSLTATKFLVYKQIINNLIAVNIEILDIQLYSEIKENFIQLMTQDQNTVTYILAGLSIAVFLIAFSFAIYDIYLTSDRLKKISQLKTEFFTAELNMKDEEKVKKIIPIHKAKDKGKNKDINEERNFRWNEENIYKDKYFAENNRMILRNVYKHLTMQLENSENCKTYKLLI